MSTNGTNGANGRNHNHNHNHNHADWTTNPRWAGIARPYSYSDVLRLRGSIQIEYTLARLGAERLWNLMHSDPYVPALGAITGNQAIEMVQGGLKAIYVSGWQVAADGNTAGDVYPDQSLYPCDSAPNLVRRINRALLRADQIESAEGKNSGTYWLAPIVADAEAGFGGSLNAYELMKAMIEAGAAAVHFEDQLSSAKKCGHHGRQSRRSHAASLSRNWSPRASLPTFAGCPRFSLRAPMPTPPVYCSPTPISATASSSTGQRTAEGFHQFRGGIDAAIARGLGLCTLCRHGLVRNFHPGPGRSAAIR